MERHHRIDYLEFSVTDLDRAKAFYGAAFGWSFTDYGPGYVGIQGGKREQGGFAKVDSVRTGGPLVVLYSDDLETTQDAVTEAGGTITKGIFEFPGGRRFEFHDPDGNALAVWTTTGG
ncbi:MAG: VOC family protein [Myxococcota bacterium]